jgi:hypothetical protein
VTSKRFAAAAGLALWFAVVNGGADGPAGQITPDAAAALTSWVEAVKTHTPGSSDAAVISVARLSYRDRVTLNIGMEFFLHVLVGGTYDTRGNRAAKLVAELARVAPNPDADAFLKQAAVLHSDVAAYLDQSALQWTPAVEPARPPADRFRIGSGMGSTTLPRDEAVPPLLTRSQLVLSQDGQIVGDAVASWNWPFARRLLELVGVNKRAARRVDEGVATDPFVGAWYHATAAYMFANELYGDETPHLERAARVLPQDARILFDRGCYAELLALPMLQVVLEATPSLRIPSAAQTNAEAERLLRRALEVDPSFLEARVRLGRLLDLRKRHKDAAAELKTALDADPKGIVGFYGHLFAGRVAQAMGESGEAARHYRDALTLFPDAQSALLASSQLALLGSDVPGTLAPLERIGIRTADFMADPWWRYHQCAGRDADDLLEQLWASVPRP